MSRFVIAGATGRVGSVVARLLLDRGNAVTIMTRSPARGAPLAALGAHVAVGSLSDVAFLTRVLEGASAFFPVLPEPLDATDFHDERCQMAEAIATAVSRRPLSHVVLLSSVGAHIGDNMGPISDLHLFERAIRATGRTVTVLRSSMFQDNIALAIEPARASGIFRNLQPDRDRGIPMVAIQDVAIIAVKVLLATPPSKSVIVNILGPAYSPRQAAATLGQALGCSVEIIDIPASEHVGALTRNGLPLPLAEAVAELQGAIASGRIVPVGDRRESGTTTLIETLNSILRTCAPALTT